MNTMNVWENPKLTDIRTGKDIVGGFDVGFDEGIPEETKDALMRFVYWVEDHYHMPVTLWVDFKYRHYLVDRYKKRVGYLFYWADFNTYPLFDNADDIPVIELPVRADRWTMEEIIASFIEAITHYFAWLANECDDNYKPDNELVESILQSYLQTLDKSGS